MAMPFSDVFFGLLTYIIHQDKGIVFYFFTPVYNFYK